MILMLKIDDIDPRKDKHFILARVGKFLDNCDPDERPDLQIEYAI